MSVERPRRSASKKLDADFISLDNLRSPAVGTPGEKRSSADVTAKDEDGEALPPPAKRRVSRTPRLATPQNNNMETTPAPAAADGETMATPASADATPRMAQKGRRGIGATPTDGSLKKAGGGRACDKMACVKYGHKPACFAMAVDRCAGSGHTSRWYHVSASEHYCNDCFDNFYRSQKEGYRVFLAWKRQWAASGKTEANVKTFMVDTFLPFWVQCTSCSRWRQLARDTDVTPDMIRSYKCDETVKTEDGATACDVPEDPRVQGVLDPSWISLLLMPPYLVSSPAAPFLVNYQPDTVGLSASVNTWRGTKRTATKHDRKASGEVDSMSGSDDEHEKEHQTSATNAAEQLLLPSVPGVPEVLEPFLQPKSEKFAFALPPDQMTEDEQQRFPQYAREQLMYLALRNLVIALWALNPKETLTVKQCIPHLICRGLVRIRCISELPSIVHYLSLRNYINGGIVSGPIQDMFPRDVNKCKVVVIGAGPAGLGAAHHLSKLGVEVTVIEGRDRVGGRVFDEVVNGRYIGRGAQLINGCINNPFALLCYQLGEPITEISDRCLLVNESGQVVDIETDSKLEFHFERMLDVVFDWKKQASEDSSLLERLIEAHKVFQAEGDVSFTENENRLLQFHIANLENACGSSLDRVSAFHWDQNEAFPQFGGPLCVLPRGYVVLLKRLARDLDIKFQQRVTGVKICSSAEEPKDGKLVKVVTEDGTSYDADYVLVTVPLSVLRQNSIAFTPPLPELKQQAIQGLGVGVLEKVALHFPRCFWAAKFGGASFFGRIPNQPETRGLFSVFHDATPRNPDGTNRDGDDGTLVTFLSGNAASLVHDKSDHEIVEMCLEALRKLFPEETIGEPTTFFVTRWQEDNFASMAYSFMPVGCPVEAYDQMAAPVDNKVFFAGEATNRAHPQTVTGAYLSGLREAQRIFELQRAS